jgi:hypothetical protein
MLSFRSKFAIAASSLALAASAHGALIAEYTFDYNGGEDTAGTRDLNFIGAAPTIAGGVYQSDGINSNYLEVTGPGGVPDFTVSLWVNTPTVNQGGFKGLFSNNSGGSGVANSWQIDSNNGEYRVAANGAPTTTLGTPTANVWENIVLQKYASNNYRAYLNGVEVADVNSNPGGLQNFRVGINRNTDNSFTGQIGLVQIWDDSTQDAAALFAAGPGIVPEPGRATLLGLGALGFLIRRRR